MTDTTALRDLLARVEADDMLSIRAFAPVFQKGRNLAVLAYRGNTAAAIALCRSVLPEWDWQISKRHAELWLITNQSVTFSHEGTHARALLICTIRGLIWEREQ